MELTTRQINAYQKVISDFAFAPTTKEKDKAKLVDVLDLLDELLIYLSQVRSIRSNLKSAKPRKTRGLV